MTLVRSFKSNLCFRVDIPTGQRDAKTNIKRAVVVAVANLPILGEGGSRKGMWPSGKSTGSLGHIPVGGSR